MKSQGREMRGARRGCNNEQNTSIPTALQEGSTPIHQQLDMSCPVGVALDLLNPLGAAAAAWCQRSPCHRVGVLDA